MMRTLLGAGLLALVLSWHPAAAAPDPGGVQELDKIMAIVNDDVITETELDREMQVVNQRLQEQAIPVPEYAALRSQVLNRLITKRLQLQVAQKTGIRVDDDTLNQAIDRIATQNHMTLQELRAAVEREGFGFAGFRNDIRDEITLNRVKQRQVESNIIVTDQEINDFMANRPGGDDANVEYRLSHILVAVPEAATPEQIQAAHTKAEHLEQILKGGTPFAKVATEYSDGRQALNGGDLGWRKAKALPSIFSPIVPHMKVGDVSEIVRSPSGFHIIELADRHQGQRHMVIEHKVRHILIETNEIVTGETARKRLLRLRERIEDGADFDALARANSADKGSAAKGGELGWVKPTELDPDFEQAVEKLKPGEISPPFRTQFGWHIVQLEDLRKVDDTDEYNRAKARQTIRDSKIEEQYQQWLRRLRDEAYVVNRLDDPVATDTSAPAGAGTAAP